MHRVGTISVALVVIATAVVACSKQSGGSAPAPASSAAAAPGAGNTPKTTLKNADLEKAYEAAFNDMSKMNDPLPKKIDAFVAAVGKPEADANGKQTWHAINGEECHKFTLSTSSGAGTNEVVNKAECGI